MPLSDPMATMTCMDIWDFYRLDEDMHRNFDWNASLSKGINVLLPFKRYHGLFAYFNNLAQPQLLQGRGPSYGLQKLLTQSGSWSQNLRQQKLSALKQLGKVKKSLANIRCEFCQRDRTQPRDISKIYDCVQINCQPEWARRGR